MQTIQMMSFDEELNSIVLNDYDLEPEDILFDQESESKLNLTIDRSKKVCSRLTLKSQRKNSRSDLSRKERRFNNILQQVKSQL